MVLQQLHTAWECYISETLDSFCILIASSMHLFPDLTTIEIFLAAQTARDLKKEIKVY